MNKLDRSLSTRMKKMEKTMKKVVSIFGKVIRKVRGRWCSGFSSLSPIALSMSCTLVYQSQLSQPTSTHTNRGKTIMKSKEEKEEDDESEHWPSSDPPSYDNSYMAMQGLSIDEDAEYNNQTHWPTFQKYTSSYWEYNKHYSSISYN